jgi:hypothetical protein
MRDFVAGVEDSNVDPGVECRVTLGNITRIDTEMKLNAFGRHEVLACGNRKTGVEGGNPSAGRRSRWWIEDP